MPVDVTAEPDTPTLLAAARRGDTAALGRLMDQFRLYLLAVADDELTPRVRPKVMPSDVVQDAYLEAYRLFERFQGDQAHEFRGWLRAILRNKVADAHDRYLGAAKRDAGRENGLPDGSAGGSELYAAGPSPSTEAVQSEQAAEVTAALDRLGDPHRQVIVWRSWEGMPFAEIGERLGRSEDAARMLFARSLERLQEVMERGGQQPP